MSGSAIRPKSVSSLPAQVFDPARLAAVRASGLVGSAPEPAFDDLAELAASITGVPRAFITVLDDERSSWKSAIGMGELPVGERHNAADESPCHLVVATGEPLIVNDARNDVRLAGIAVAEQLGIGAWAGYPIHGDDGQVLGTLCVIDAAPRSWTGAQMKALAILARSVTSEIELRATVRRMASRIQALEDATEQSAELARTLQESLLPSTLPIPPGLQTAARYLPAGQGTRVLGDFYDLFAAGPTHWCAVLGDVSGHGVEAAMLTALARYTVRADAPRHISPARVLNQLNHALLAQQASPQRYLTAICAIFRDERDDGEGDPGPGITGVLTTAGHPSALLRHADGRVEEIRSEGAILGVFSDAGLTSARFTLRPGQTLLFYTDGVTEAHPPARMRLFGEERLCDLLAACDGLDADAIVERISSTVMAFCEHDPADDIALLALRVPPAS
ncbi:PP2C family protein-serine/threonine phosphatase [Nonomuraea sp. NPDC002799]